MSLEVRIIGAKLFTAGERVARARGSLLWQGMAIAFAAGGRKFPGVPTGGLSTGPALRPRFPEAADGSLVPPLARKL